MKLAVQQFGTLVGLLESTENRGIVFRYDAAYLIQPGARALSQALPLRDTEYPQASALPFFAGLLPDGDLRRRIAEYLHISETSSLKLLEALGGECAGTVSLLRLEDDGSLADTKTAELYEEIPQEELERLIS